MSTDLKFVEPADVKTLITGDVKDNVLVVDVRDEDFELGHVKGAVNKPSQEFADDASVDAFIKEHFTDKVEKVVVHCQLSQVRGPKAAGRIIQRLAAVTQEDPSVKQPDIAVMRTGFSGFEQLYGGTDLVDRS